MIDTEAYEEIYTQFKNKDISASEAEARLIELGALPEIAANDVFIWAGGDDVVELDDNGTEKYGHSGMTPEEVEARLKE